ncbi:PREDICTED: regulator of G-protein signaling 14-like, partial [Chlamydotis macqueenii]|uniref:regulator of G-protein signaling 14-like n=1 Tax=Chlamydotis macqueenii TaxID=187382 RepID=UPI000529EFD0
GGEGGGSAMLWRESQGSLNSSASLDLGFLSSASTTASPWTEPLLPLCRLEISSLNKTIRITAKSTKRIREALQPVLGKYGVSMELQGEPAALDLEKLVSTVAAQKLILETPADVRVMENAEAAAAPSPLWSEEGSPTGAEPDTLWEMPSSFSRPRSSAAMNLNRRTYDLDGLVELRNREHSCNDQRGLLSKEDLVLPDFLQLPGQDESACEGSDQPHAPHTGSEGNGHPEPAEPAPAQPLDEQPRPQPR